MPIITGFRYRPPLSSLMPKLKLRVTILPKIFFLAASKIGLKFFTWYHETQFLTKFALFWPISDYLSKFVNNTHKNKIICLIFEKNRDWKIIPGFRA